MSVVPTISIARVKKEIKLCREYCEKFGWQISEVNESSLTFTVLMTSPVDLEDYLIEFNFKDYNQYPPIIEFIEPDTKLRGTRRAYPKYKSDSFFHTNLFLCHPCSRRAYQSLGGPHSDWQLIGWLDNPAVGSLTTISTILMAVYTRIIDPDNYEPRSK